MRRPAVLIGLAFAGIAAVMIGTNAPHAQPEPVKRTVLLKTALEGLRRTEGMVVVVELAPGGATGKHDHLGNELAYVLDGSIILEVGGKEPVTFKTGDTFYQPLRQVHDVKNASTTAPAKVLMVLIEKSKKVKKKKASEPSLPSESSHPSPPLTPRSP